MLAGAPLRVAHAAVLFALLWSVPARAGVSGAASCAPQMAACGETRCPGAEGKARRACRDTCRALTGCRAGGARIRTLATVVTECRSGVDGFTGRQRLEIHRGDRPPVTLVEISAVQAVPDPDGLCRLYGDFRDGPASVTIGAFQRLGVSPDGRVVVFEVTGDHVALRGPPFALEEEGIFRVRADGSGLRRLGPASRQAAFRIVGSPLPPGIVVPRDTLFYFSPDGRTVVFSDRGPGADGADAAQLVTLDLASGQRTQVTRFLASSQGNPNGVETGGIFLADGTIGGFAYDRDVGRILFTVGRDGSLRPLPQPVAVPGSQLVPSFRVTGVLGTAVAIVLELPATATRPVPGFPVRELFLSEGRDLLQLTNLGRADTLPMFLGRDARRVFFQASADPLLRNPSETCQIFSIDRLGGGLRQLTSFRPVRKSPLGCTLSPAPDCGAGLTGFPAQDPVTGSMVFDATCDPFGTNPNGGQLFAMRPDGSGLRQLTTYRGLVVEPDGTVTVELPGPTDYSGRKF